MSQPIYQKRQWMKVLWITLPAITLLVMLLETQGQTLAQRINALTLIGLIDCALLALLGSLSIRLYQDELCWSFGFLGRPKWRLPLAEIRAVELCQTRWTEGWGIRFTKDGMLYNAAGSGAVRISKLDGSSLRLGCAEPEILVAQLQQLIDSNKH